MLVNHRPYCLQVHLDSLNNLTKELNNYANKAHSMKGNGQKYAELLEAFKVVSFQMIKYENRTVASSR